MTNNKTSISGLVIVAATVCQVHGRKSWVINASLYLGFFLRGQYWNRLWGALPPQPPYACSRLVVVPVLGWGLSLGEQPPLGPLLFIQSICGLVLGLCPKPPLSPAGRQESIVQYYEPMVVLPVGHRVTCYACGRLHISCVSCANLPMVGSSILFDLSIIH